MEKQDRRSLKSEAKSFLSDSEYKKFSRALKNFCKTKDIEQLGIELLSVCQNLKTRKIFKLTRQFLPENTRTEFMEIIRNLNAQNRSENGDPNHRQISSKLDGNDANSRRKNSKRFITMERSSLQIDFGFRIKGDLFIKQDIIVGQVDNNSIAELSGLQEGVRIININGVQCKRARKADVIQIVKNSLRLCLELIALDEDVQFVEEITTSVKHVTLCSNDSGWLGITVRGGIDYGCDIYITSTDDDSPADRAGLQVGDVITEVNRVSLHGKTHIQAVEQIITTCPPITFTITTNKDQGTSNQASIDRHRQPRTPLRILNRIHQPRARLVPQQQTIDWISDIAYGVDSLCIQGTPPPPYSAEIPEAHRVFQRFSNGDSDDQHNDHIYDAVCNLESSLLVGCCDDEIGYCENNDLNNIYENVSNGDSQSTLMHHSTANNDCENEQLQFQGTGLGSNYGLYDSEHIYDEVCETELSMSGVDHNNCNHSSNGNHGENDYHSNNSNHDNDGNCGECGCQGNSSNNGYHSDDGNYGNSGNHGSRKSPKQSSLLDDIHNFKKSTLRKTECPFSVDFTCENGTRHQEHGNLLGVINAALVNRARVFESSLASCSETCDSFSEWEL